MTTCRAVLTRERSVRSTNLAITREHAVHIGLVLPGAVVECRCVEDGVALHDDSFSGMFGARSMNDSPKPAGRPIPYQVSASAVLIEYQRHVLLH